MKLHINDPEKIARRAMELTVNDTSDLQHDTQAGLGRSERALAHGIISAMCETLRSMFEHGVEIDVAAKETADEAAAEELSARERDLEERELALAQRMAASGIEPPNESIALVQAATGPPTGNPEAIATAALQEKLRQESIDSAALNAEAHGLAPAEDPKPAVHVDSLSYGELQEHAESLGLSRTDSTGKMKKKAVLLDEIHSL
jgi:hypothetical protein